MQIFDFKQKYNELKNKFEVIKNQTSHLSLKLLDIEKQQQDPKLWSDPKSALEINKQKKSIEKRLSKINNARTKLDDLNAILELIEEDNSLFNEGEFLQLSTIAETTLEEIWISTLLSEEYDNASAILTLQAGAGGEEAQDWAEMLARMYVRYAEEQDYKIELIDKTMGDGAGIKSQTFLVEGENAYGYLKTEKGVHRLVRLSPFDSNNRRHTSFASLEVSPYAEDNIQIEIKPDELKFDTYKSGGAGGQHVNKTESAVRITHLPSGIIVQCQNERSQIKNKELALKLLKSKLIERRLEEKEAEKQKKFGEAKKIEWGSQIRSYILHPYNLVKDHRTNYESSDTTAVLDGKIQQFINEFLKAKKE